MGRQYWLGVKFGDMGLCVKTSTFVVYEKDADLLYANTSCDYMPAFSLDEQQNKQAFSALVTLVHVCIQICSM